MPELGASPIKNSRAASAPYTSQHVWRDERITAFYEEISGRVVGPVIGLDFLNFIDGGGLKKRNVAEFKAGLGELESAQKEIAMYEPWVVAMNHLCPDLMFVDAHNKSMQFESYEIKPDVHVYPKTSKRDIKTVELMIEFKFDTDDDPFADGDAAGFERDSKKARDTLGQIALYATAHLANQFRTHIFSALIFPGYLRLLRWDRSGVVVTEELPLDDALVIIFFQRLNDATPEQRGSDTSVRTAVVPEHEAVRIRRVLGCGSDDSLLEISVGNNKYIVPESMHFHGAGSLTGRATRKFKAFCTRRNELVFLKDTWRVIWSTLKPEHETYATLQANNVENVPECFDAADVVDNSNHRTQTKQWAEKLGLDLTLRTLQHYRLVLEHMDFGLEDFMKVRDMVVAVRDAAEAHRQAVVKAKVLHRDISVGNIMMKMQNGVLRGFLIDWDLCRTISEDVTGEAQHERTGTWQFIAIRLTQLPRNQEVLIPNRVDDVESFLHVLMWMALRYTLHSLPIHYLSQTIYENFDAAYRGLRGRTYSTAARTALLHSGFLVEEAKFANPGLCDVLEQLSERLSHRYKNPLAPMSQSANKARLDGYNRAVEVKKQALEELENDDGWLVNTLATLLDVEADWHDANDKVIHEIIDPRTRNAVKRKSESELASTRVESSRLANQETVHDEEPIPEEILESLFKSK